MKFKKIMKTTAVILGVLCAFQNPAQMIASAKEKLYISELKISYGEDEESAKKWLTDNDYLVLDKNLNSGSDDLFSKKRAVYVGYKTTTDYKEAITDMKVMNMSGDYSLVDYEQLLENVKESTDAFIEDITLMLTEYRANYKAGKENALFAHDLLNQYTDDDTGMLLGDLLLNETKEELGDKYDALSDDEKKQHADLVTMRMQANVSVLDNIVQYLAIGINSSNSNSDWIKEIEAADYDALFEEYQALDPLASAPSIESRMIVDFDADAKYLAVGIEGLKTYLSYYTDSGIAMDAPEEEIQQYFDTHEEGDAVVWTDAGMLYTTLKEINYNGSSLAEFILDEEYDFVHDIDDRIELYPLLNTMSPAQVAALAEINLSSLMLNSFSNEESWKLKRASTSLTETASSIYFGVNRKIFEEGGIGLTGSANSLQNGSNKTFDEGIFGYGIKTSEIIFGGAALVTASIGLYIAIANREYGECYRTLTNNLEVAQGKFVDATNKLNDAVENEFMVEFDILSDDWGVQPNQVDEIGEFLSSEVGESWLKKMNQAKQEEQLAQNNLNAFVEKNGVRISDYIGLAICIISLILVVIDVACMIRDVYEYYHRELSPIPSMMVHTYQDEAD
ncbi:MAG: hypothetical protein IKP69_07075, partial [Oscillospiraceae bacterium]|nr:hypothetical protein [Oscillospiraceae bacterium]